jgi:hypothetical protein
MPFFTGFVSVDGYSSRSYRHILSVNFSQSHKSYYMCCSTLSPCINIFEGIALIICTGSSIVVYFRHSKFSEVVFDL